MHDNWGSSWITLSRKLLPGNHQDRQAHMLNIIISINQFSVWHALSFSGTQAEWWRTSSIWAHTTTWALLRTLELVQTLLLRPHKSMELEWEAPAVKKVRAQKGYFECKIWFMQEYFYYDQKTFIKPQLVLKQLLPLLPVTVLAYSMFRYFQFGTCSM